MHLFSERFSEKVSTRFCYDLLAGESGLANLLSKGHWILIADFPSFSLDFQKYLNISA